MPNPTAAMLVIGDEILSGRTRDANMHYLASELTRAGVDLREVRVISDDPDAIVAAVQALSARMTWSSPRAGSGRRMTTSPPRTWRAPSGARSRCARMPARCSPRITRPATGSERRKAAHGAHPRRRHADRQPDQRRTGLQHRERACDGRGADDLSGDARLGPAHDHRRRADPVAIAGRGARRGRYRRAADAISRRATRICPSAPTPICAAAPTG